ncbi:hypothetical protein GOP47_0003664 [Adiantum capillus-veneris]|uniref:Uncharacterized protein n=1 Tax=Adiantum capillus-veneris TaxID=13818 RepID=A0A9D4V726_ADICA|nr:hypothetical protein GOP47_0003664 [Adiantum capillus-veneris]
MLLLKLASVCGDAKLDVVAEIKLSSKWDDANRTSVAKADAVASLFKMLDVVTEIKLFSKWDDANRTSLAKAECCRIVVQDAQ